MIYCLLDHPQYGFSEKMSCKTRLTMLKEDLVKNASAGKQIVKPYGLKIDVLCIVSSYCPYILSFIGLLNGL